MVADLGVGEVERREGVVAMVELSPVECWEGVVSVSDVGPIEGWEGVIAVGDVSPVECWKGVVTAVSRASPVADAGKNIREIKRGEAREVGEVELLEAGGGSS